MTPEDVRLWLEQAGFLKTYSNTSAIPLSSVWNVPISQDDINRFSPFNLVSVQNTNTFCNTKIKFDGSATNYVFCPKSFEKNVNGRFFQNIVIENIDTVNEIAIGEVYVTIMKTIDELMSLKIKKELKLL